MGCALLALWVSGYLSWVTLIYIKAKIAAHKFKEAMLDWADGEDYM